MDQNKLNAKEHAMDLEKNLTRLGDKDTTSIFRWVDTLSYKGDVDANKYQVTATHVKFGKMMEYMTEVGKAILETEKSNGPVNYNTYTQMFAGSDPVLVTVRSLKDGFKELEENYNGRPATAFKDAYISTYGQADWENRVKLLVDDVASREVYLMKKRSDLSSQ